MADWKYGNSWEKFPIKELEVVECGNNILMVADIVKNIDNVKSLMNEVEISMVYSDPPWNTGNVNAFRTKAGISERGNIEDLWDTFLFLVNGVPVVYMEAGLKQKELLKSLIRASGGFIFDIIEIKYYKKYPCLLFVFSMMNESHSVKIHKQLEGKDDDETPEIAIRAEDPTGYVLDLCTGRGGTGRACYKLGKNFIGTELNKRRLSNLIEWYSNKGVPIKWRSK